MKASTVLVAGLAQIASAHYFFDSVVSGGVAGPSFKYIRDFTRQTKYNPIKFSSNPAADIRDNSTIDGVDARCNQGAFTFASKTGILEVAAGGNVEVKLGVGASMQHPGPALYYMSKAPTGDVTEYDGSGDWFKIGDEGVCNFNGDFTNNAWCTWNMNTLNATIPKATPSGEYLLRFEHIGVHRSHVNEPEHFVSCVQVRVTGGGNGTPGPMVKFPGAYKSTDPYANFSIYNGYKAFPMPGPEVWDGSSNGSSSGASSSTAAASTAPASTATKSASSAAATTTPTLIKATSTSSSAFVAVPTTTLVKATSAAAAVPTTTHAATTVSPVKPTSTTCNTSTTPAAAATATGSAQACAVKYAQCGGLEFTGATCCEAGSVCRRGNRWYSQCI